MFYLLTDFCSPAKIYVMMAFLTLLYFVIINDETFWLIVKAILFIMWTFLLQQMCKLGYKAIAWTAAIIPHIIFLIVTVKSSTT